MGSGCGPFPRHHDPDADPGKEIEPAMGKILNLPLYSKENPTGFGCLNCHTQEGK